MCNRRGWARFLWNQRPRRFVDRPFGRRITPHHSRLGNREAMTASAGNPDLHVYLPDVGRHVDLEDGRSLDIAGSHHLDCSSLPTPLDLVEVLGNPRGRLRTVNPETDELPTLLGDRDGEKHGPLSHLRTLRARLHRLHLLTSDGQDNGHERHNKLLHSTFLLPTNAAGVRGG